MPQPILPALAPTPTATTAAELLSVTAPVPVVTTAARSTCTDQSASTERPFKRHQQSVVPELMAPPPQVVVRTPPQVVVMLPPPALYHSNLVLCCYPLSHNNNQQYNHSDLVCRNTSTGNNNGHNVLFTQARNRPRCGVCRNLSTAYCQACKLALYCCRLNNCFYTYHNSKAAQDQFWEMNAQTKASSWFIG